MFAATLLGLSMLLNAPQTPLFSNTEPCEKVNTCRYMPNPVDGPLMPTWNTENTYGGWTNMPVQCDPVTYECRMWAPQ